MPRKLRSTRPKAERAFLVGVQHGRHSDLWTLDDSLAELKELARSAGAHVAGVMTQRLKGPTQLYLGRGKLEELKGLVQELAIDMVVCDDELAPNQQRNLETALGEVKVIDRTALILHIFASRAQTHEGRLQVELAQHEYLLPRLAGQWSHLERLGGGVGTRGPGETQIETDRRLVRSRIQKIKSELEEVRRHRGRHRARRKESGTPVASLVGYTNAGKSTLLNALTQATVRVEDKPFSTLDPITRRLRLPSGRELLVTDTVGFIQKLPPTIVAAFRATLEEINESAILVHVVDIAHPNAGAQADVVEGVLKDLDLSTKPSILVLNKVDLLKNDAGKPLPDPTRDSTGEHPRAVFTSALRGVGLDRLCQEIDALLAEPAPPAVVAPMATAG